MYYCNICNYFANSNNLFKKHLQSKNHLKNQTSKFTCSNCAIDFFNEIEFYKHLQECKNIFNISIINKIHQLELSKKDCQLELELERKQREIDRLTFEKQLALKEIENKNLQLCNINGNVNGNVNFNNTINKYTKIDNLNVNFPRVLDMKTFIKNYKTDYGLTKDQTRILLENCKNGGIESCISTLSFYLRESAIKQYNDFFTFKTKIDKSNSVFPYILYDMSLREHYEKFESGKWNRIKATDNIKALITITDDQVYKHQNEYLKLKCNDKKKIINGLLKGSSYQLLQELDPELYKLHNSTPNKELNTTNTNPATNLDTNVDTNVDTIVNAKNDIEKDNEEEDEDDDDDDEDNEDNEDNEDEEDKYKNFLENFLNSQND